MFFSSDYIMGIDNICFRTRVGLFSCIANSLRTSLSLLDVICINILCLCGVHFLHIVILLRLLTNNFFTLKKDTCNTVVPLKNPGFFCTDIHEDCQFSFLYSFIIPFILITLSNDVHVNPGPLSNVSSSSDPVSNDSSLSENSISTITQMSSNVPINNSLLESKFSFVHLNVQSLKPKIDLLCVELNDYSILSFTETWMKDSDITSDIHLHGYQEPFCFCRDNQLGGGIAVYVKSSTFARRRNDLEIPTIESVWIEISHLGMRFLYGTFYRPPNSPVSLWSDIENSIDLAYNSNINNIIIVGDFNADFLVDNLQLNHFRNILHMYNMSQLVQEPTHYTENSQSLIDVILASDTSIILKTYVGECFLNQPTRYHCPIYGFLQSPITNTKCFKRNIWLFNEGNYDEYREKLSRQNWDDILNSENVNTCVLKFNELVVKIAKECIPNKLVTIRKSDPPWLNNSTKKLIRQRNRAHVKAKQSNNPNAWSKFRKIRNKCISVVWKSKHCYYNKISSKLLESRNPTQW